MFKKNKDLHTSFTTGGLILLVRYKLSRVALATRMSWWKLEASEERIKSRSARKAWYDIQVDCFSVIWTGISTS